MAASVIRTARWRSNDDAAPAGAPFAAISRAYDNDGEVTEDAVAFGFRDAEAANSCRVLPPHVLLTTTRLFPPSCAKFLLLAP